MVSFFLFSIVPVAFGIKIGIAVAQLVEFRFGASERLTFSQARTALVVELKSSEKREVTVVANDLNRLNQLLSLRDVGTTRKFDMSALYKTFSGGGGPKFPLASILEGVGIKDAVLENAGALDFSLLAGNRNQFPSEARP